MNKKRWPERQSSKRYENKDTILSQKKLLINNPPTPQKTEATRTTDIQVSLLLITENTAKLFKQKFKSENITQRGEKN